MYAFSMFQNYFSDLQGTKKNSMGSSNNTSCIRVTNLPFENTCIPEPFARTWHLAYSDDQETDIKDEIIESKNHFS